VPPLRGYGYIVQRLKPDAFVMLNGTAEARALIQPKFNLECAQLFRLLVGIERMP
jgi:hypothetical protein